MRSTLALLAVPSVALSFAVLSACSSSSTPGGADSGTESPDGAVKVDSGSGTNEAGASDGATDASDAKAPSDGGDSGTDAKAPSDGGDSGTDAGATDAGMDATATDAGMDATASDSGSDSGATSDAGGDAGSDSGANDHGAAFATLVGGSFLVRFVLASPDAVTMTPVTGLGANEVLVAIDYRPANGRLYGLTVLDSTPDGGSTTTSFRVYTLVPSTGVATPVGAGVDTGVQISLANVDIDFNPVVDRLRVVSRLKSFRMHPDTGALVATDSDVQPISASPFLGNGPKLVGVAYDRTTFDGNAPAATTLFALDSDLRFLLTLGGIDGTPSPNAGQAFVIGNTVLPFSSKGKWLDIAADGTAWATYEGLGKTYVATINLSTGAPGTALEIGTDLALRGLAVAP